MNFDIIAKKILIVKGFEGNSISDLPMSKAGHITIIDLTPADQIKLETRFSQTIEPGRLEIRSTDTFTYLRNSQKQFDIIFVAQSPLEPTFWIDCLRTIAERPHLLSDQGIILIEVFTKDYEMLNLSSLVETDHRRYGTVELLTFNKI